MNNSKGFQRQMMNDSMGFQRSDISALVSDLEPLLKVPKQQIEKYVQLQSVQTVDELSKIVQSVQSGSCKARGSNEQAPPPTEEESAQDALRKMLPWKTTYAS